MLKPFKYKTRRIGIPEYHNGVNRIGIAETLVGTVQGKSASDLEERMSRAFDKMKVPYEFRARISSSAMGTQRLTKAISNLPGELEIDHLVNDGVIIPVQIDGEISHFMTPFQKLQDEEKTDAINEFGQVMGWHEVIRVPYVELKTQEDADDVARRILNGFYIPTHVK